MTHPNSFPKSEHLCGDKLIARLFEKGEAFICYPIRVVFVIEPKQENTETARVMVSVPKKRFKRANKRNRLKRLTREAYRLNKSQFIASLNEKQLQILVAFNYVSNDESDFTTIEKKMKTALERLQNKIETYSAPDC